MWFVVIKNLWHNLIANIFFSCFVKILKSNVFPCVFLLLFYSPRLQYVQWPYFYCLTEKKFNFFSFKRAYKKKLWKMYEKKCKQPKPSSWLWKWKQKLTHTQFLFYSLTKFQKTSACHVVVVYSTSHILNIIKCLIHAKENLLNFNRSLKQNFVCKENLLM